MPPEFFAGNVTLGINNRLYDKADPARPMYHDIKIKTTELQNAFLVPKEPVAPGKAKRPTTRDPTPTDAREFLAMAQDLHNERGFGPSIKESEVFAKERTINRDWARAQHQSLPEELQRARGGRGSARHLSKSLGQPN